jgi:UDP-N-acetylglucosamine acyltransferase
MSAQVDPRAVVGKDVVLGEGTTVGAYAVIEDGVRIGERCAIWPHAFVGRGTTMGNGNEVHPYAVVGHVPQDVSFDPARETFTRIGDGNRFREHCSIHRATKAGQATVIGDGGFFMAGSHVAHDCKVGNRVILVNGAALTGHCEVDDSVILSGFTGLHQFSRVGRLAIMSALSVTNKDLPPFFIFGGRPARAQGVNIVGLRRAGIGRDVRLEIKRAYKILYREGRTLPEALEAIERELKSAECRALVEFVRASKRGIASVAGARGDDDTLNTHFAKGAPRRSGEAEPEEDDEALDV